MDTPFHVVFFGPLPWSDIQRNGFRKTSGAMFKAFWDRSDVGHLTYVQFDRRWGAGVSREVVDSRVDVVGLPIGFPYERLAFVRRINRALQSKLLAQKVSLSQDFQLKRVYWFYDWFAIELIERLPKGLTVMEITDSVEQFHSDSSAARRLLNNLREKAKEHVDLVISVHTGLVQEGDGGAYQTIVLPNGISNDFLREAQRVHSEPRELGGIPHPRLCVVGAEWSLNHRVDHEFLIDVMGMLADWHLVLIGLAEAESPGLKKLIAHSRVHAIGLMPQSELIPYIQHCDVCVVPYRSNPSLRDALKTYEYLACGKPVLVRAEDVVDELSPYVRKEQDASGFAKACLDLLASEWSEKAKRVRSILETMTWENRAEKCAQICRNRIIAEN